MWASIEIFIGPTVAASGKRWIAGVKVKGTADEVAEE